MRIFFTQPTAFSDAEAKTELSFPDVFNFWKSNFVPLNANDVTRGYLKQFMSVSQFYNMF